MMVLVIGFVSQVLFFMRTLLQWILSERARKVLSPTIYWVLSIVASYLFFIYGWFRNDFSILLGQLVSYYIYIWNLNETGVWNKLNVFLRAILVVTPIFAIGFVLKDSHLFFENFLQNKSIPVWLVIFGSLGQLVFALRFVYQWIYSMKRNESLLPLGFWIISLVGSGIIVVYGLIRVDPILIMGQSVGFVAYTRNIFLYRQEFKKLHYAESISY
ncbi:MAG TPA: lipid-A-disaccharide synthase N-terminal domain-containing protein [Prolixibacteraceae bacterium]|nr:lipid-A-disaccharide synthase N-terminal domain-containing protein [Prolixibacteraceae bacterium]